MTMTSVFAEITKTAPQADGSLLVYGKATDSTLDLDGQKCDPAWLTRAMPVWFTEGNGAIREQHDAHRAVGKATQYEPKDGAHWITAKIVDPVAKAKTEAGIFSGFSIGIKSPRIVKDASAPNGRIVDGRVIECSLVDVPCNPSATLTICKAAKPGMEVTGADLDEERGLVKCEEFSVDQEQVVANVADGAMSLNKARAALGLPDSEAEKVGKPSPLDMPGAKKSAEGSLTEAEVDAKIAALRAEMKAAAGEQTMVSLHSEPFAAVTTQAVVAEADKATDTEHLDAPAAGQKCADCGEDGHLSCGVTDGVKAGEFDREAAKALVEEITKADAGDGLGQDESDDISGAEQVISQLGELIISEAQSLVDMPSQDCDIHLLMSAVDAVRIFNQREKLEQGAIDPDSMALLSADADVEKAKYSADELRQMLKDGKAFKNPDGDPSYPIDDKDDLAKAIKAVGRGSGDHDAIRKYIKRRAAALGASSMIPEDWNSDGSNKAADVELVETPGSTDTADSTEVEKTTHPESTKAAVAIDDDALGTAISAALEKAFSSDELEKSDNPLRKAMKGAAAEAAAESVIPVIERLVKVEAMATPGGPALRRSDVERKEARKTDLLIEAARLKTLAQHSEDQDLRRGYATKAAQLEAEVKALVA